MNTILLVILIISMLNSILSIFLIVFCVEILSLLRQISIKNNFKKLNESMKSYDY